MGISKAVYIRLPNKIYDQVKAYCEANSLTVSEYLRMQVYRSLLPEPLLVFDRESAKDISTEEWSQALEALFQLDKVNDG